MARPSSRSRPIRWRGSHEIYVTTTTGVFHLLFNVNYPSGTPPQFVGSGPRRAPVWQKETGNLFKIALTFPQANNALGFQLVHDPKSPTVAEELALSHLGAMAVDWRFGVQDPANPNGTHPVLYVGGDTGVYRSMDNGLTWTVFPAITDGTGPLDQGYLPAAVNGGYLPATNITSLQISAGNISQTTGVPDQPGGANVLIASTYGRGNFAIQLPISSPLNPVEGPRVVLASPNVQGAANNPVSTLSKVFVTFSGTLNPATFDTTLDPSNLSKIRSFQGPNGPVQVTAIHDITPAPPTGKVSLHNIYEIDFVTQTAGGNYVLQIGPAITDFPGHQMDQNQNGINGEDPADRFVATFAIVSTTTVPNDNALFVSGLFHDVLNRQADTTGFNASYAPIDAARLSLLPPFGFNVLGSLEYRNNLVVSSFTKYLGRQASSSDVNSYAASLGNGLTDEQFFAILDSSDEFYNKAGGTDSAWVERQLPGHPRPSA